MLYNPSSSCASARATEWSREKVKNYTALHRIGKEAWNVIGTTFESIVPIGEESIVPGNGTTVPLFTEGLLRSILDRELIMTMMLRSG